MLRASAASEQAGVPTSSLVCEGFIGQAGATAIGLGMPNLPLALVPGHVGNQSAQELQRNIREATCEAVIANLLEEPSEAPTIVEVGRAFHVLWVACP